MAKSKSVVKEDKRMRLPRRRETATRNDGSMWLRFACNSIMKRILSSLVIVAVLAGVIYMGSPVLEMGVLLVGILLAWEWANMVPNKGNGLYLGAYVFALSVFVASFSLWSLGAIALTAIWVWYKAKNEPRRGLLTLGVVYIALGVGSLVGVYQQLSVLGFLWLILVVCGMDIGGFVVGCSVKGPKLCPKISPNKTWSGLFGGFLFAVIFSSLFIWWWFVASQDFYLNNISYNDYWAEFKKITLVSGGLAVVFALISQIGDLIESAIKRSLGIKDASDLIPGHGGVFDRIDGLIFAAPLLLLLSFCVQLYYMYGGM